MVSDKDKPSSTDVDDPFYKRTVPNLLHDLISFGYCPSAVQFPFILGVINGPSISQGEIGYLNFGGDGGEATMVVPGDTATWELPATRGDRMTYINASDFEHGSSADVRGYTTQPCNK